MARSLPFIAALLLIFIAACSTKVDINAPARDIYVVYGVLNPADSFQYIRVAKAFQTDGDALQYANQNDLSVKGLSVTLKGFNRTYIGEEVTDAPRDSGIFTPYCTYYRIPTYGGTPLYAGYKYELTISKPNDEDFGLTAYTWVPTRPKITDPVTGYEANRLCRPLVELEKGNTIRFSKGISNNPNATAVGLNYEVNCWLEFQENGQNKREKVRKELQYSPTENGGYPCKINQSTLCYDYDVKDLISIFRLRMTNPAGYTFIDEPRCETFSGEQLMTAAWFEVVSQDTFLSRYNIVKNPANAGFNTVSVEYTNIKGKSNKYDAYGIFGSIHADVSYFDLSDCSKYLLKLNNQAQPTDPPCVF